MKFNSIYNNFASGELSRNLFGRTDLEEYFKGLSEMTNFLPIRQGGASFRPGTVLAGNIIPTTASATFDFAPRDDEPFLIILEPGYPIQIVNKAGGGPTITQPDYPWNERIDFSDSTEAYNAPSDDATHRELVESLQVAISGDLFIVVDGTGRLAPIVIARVATDTFIVDSLISPSTINLATNQPYLSPPEINLRMPFKDTNLSNNIRLKPSALTGVGITILAEDASAVAVPYFEGDVVGMLVRITHAAVTGMAQITAKVSDSNVTATVIGVDFGATAASSDFEVSAWNPNDGYPRTVCFFEGRLIFGGSKKYPDTIWCSQTGNIYHFMQTRLAQDSTTDVSNLNYFGSVKVSDAFSFIPASVGANNIQWLYPADALLVGTSRTEFAITGGQESSMSVSSIFVKSISAHGSSKVQPLKVGSSVIFISSDGKRVLEIPKRLVEYSSATDWTGLAAGIVEKSIEGITTDLASVIPLKSQIIKLTWDDSLGVLWCVCKNSASDDTSLISLTIDRTSKVTGWAKHKLAGKPFISSITSYMDISSFGSSRIFLMLKRDGATRYSLESFSFKTMHESYNPDFLPAGGPLTVYLDGAFYGSTSATPDELVLGADNTLRFADGATYGVIQVSDNVGTYLGSYVEAGDVLTIPGLDLTKSYIVGALYEGEIKTMPIEAGAQFGSAQGSPRRAHEVVLYLDRSLSGVYKASKSANQFSIVASKGTPAALYTGEVKLSLNASPDDHQIIIKQTEPYPLTVLWLLTKGYTYDV